MNTNLAPVRPCHSGDDTTATIRRVLSLKEAVVLAGVPEKRVRKDIENGVLAPPCIQRFDDSHWCVTWGQVFTFAAIYRNDHLDGAGALRVRALHAVNNVTDTFSLGTFAGPFVGGVDNMRTGMVFSSVGNCSVCEPCDNLMVDIDTTLRIDLAKVFHEVMPRVDLYAEGLKRIETKEGVLGGEAVFKGTRLSVHHVGKMAERGEPIENILSDYSHLNLTENDVAFAQLYCRANPPRGRPRMNAEDRGDNAVPSR